MNSLQVSQNILTFESSESIKTIQLKNVCQFQNYGKPLMYKIKTNRIECVDAKPSCGYISGKRGQNQISICIRSLSKKSYQAKVQILYIYNSLITEQIVQKNKKHFDLVEYNDFYERIKTDNQKDVKTALLKVIKKGIVQPESVINPPVQSVQPVQQKKNKEQVKLQEKKQIDMITLGRKKFTNIILVIFIIGILIGYSIGMYGSRKEIQQNPLVSSGRIQENQFRELDGVNVISQNDHQSVETQVTQNTDSQFQLPIVKLLDSLQDGNFRADQQLNTHQESQQI